MRTRFILTGLTLIFLLLITIPSWAGNYEHNLDIQEDKDMTFSWTLNEEKATIDIQISAKTTGWVGIGFNPEKAMLGANIILGYVKKGKVKIEDHYGHQKRAHQSDKKQGGESHITNAQGVEEDGITTLSFTIPLDSGDKYDPAIKLEGSNTLIFAYGGKRDSLRSRHSYRSTWDIDLRTGKGQKI